MFARVSRFTGGVEQLGEGLALIREAFGPRIEKEPGFGGLMVMVDHDIGVGYVISFWKSEQDLAASRELGEHEAETAAEMFGRTVDVSNCEVAFSTFPTFTE